MRRSRISGFRVGVIMLLVLVPLVYLGFTKAIPFKPHYEIKAAFRDTNGMKPGSPVRIAGVDVGEVSEVDHLEPGSRSGVATLRIEDKGRPVHSDATAKIRPRIFLEGNFFVELRPGTPGTDELDDGATLGIDQTASPVQADQVLKALDSDVRADLRTALAELARSFDDGGAAAWNRSFEYQAPAFRYSAVVNEALLGKRTGDLGNLVRDTGAVAAAVDRDRPALQALIVDFNTTAAALAREDDSLRAGIEELPETLREANPALDALNASFPDLRRLARAALPGARSTPETVDAVLPLVKELRGLVRPEELRGLSEDLSTATPGLTQLAVRSVPLLRQVRLASSCQNEVILPWTQDTVPDRNFPASGPVYQSAVKWLPALAGESRSFDANAQWFKVLGSGGVETFQLGTGTDPLFGVGLLPIVGVNPQRPSTRPPLRPDVPCETQEAPDLRSKAAGPPTSVDTNASSPRARERAARARSVASELLRGDLLREGLENLNVLDRLATTQDIEAIARRAGNLAQLRDLQRKVRER